MGSNTTNVEKWEQAAHNTITRSAGAPIRIHHTLSLLTIMVIIFSISLIIIIIVIIIILLCRDARGSIFLLRARRGRRQYLQGGTAGGAMVKIHGAGHFQARTGHFQGRAKRP